MIDGGGSRLLVQHFQGDFGGVFFGVVDILAVVPVAGGDILTLDTDRAGPSGTTSWFPTQGQSASAVKHGSKSKSRCTVILQLQCNAETRKDVRTPGTWEQNIGKRVGTSPIGDNVEDRGD